MFGIPFLSSKKKNTESYIFMLFLAGEKAHGFAFEESVPNNRSTLYSEHIDSFLKDAVSKIETIIGNCERDLGEHVYLTKTVLFLNSLYTTDSGAIREDFRQHIKKLVKDLDLVNLGYVNLYEVVNYTYGKRYEHYCFVEESVYDYALSFFHNGTLTKTTQVAKTQDEAADRDEIKKQLGGEDTVIGFYYHKGKKNPYSEIHVVTEEELTEMFVRIYFKKQDKEPETTLVKKSAPVVRSEAPAVVAPLNVSPEPQMITEEAPLEDSTAMEREADEVTFSSRAEETTLDDLPDAPGFHELDGSLEQEEMESSTPMPEPITDFDEEERLPMPPKSKKFSMPRIPARGVVIPAVAIVAFLGIAIAYFSMFHSAVIALTTKKENFSSNLTFDVNVRNPQHTYSYQFEVKTDKTATGEKIVGERSEGEVTVYNVTFKDRSLSEGDELRTGSGVLFEVVDGATVPAASTSSASFGKRTIKLKASEVGADGNIDKGEKLTFTGVSDSEIYAVSASDFSGGFKKTVRVFSEEDSEKLEEDALKQIEKEVKDRFDREKGRAGVLFVDTLKVSDGQKRFSAKVNEEVNSVTLTYTGTAEVVYLLTSDLIKRVQREKLDDKEFVKDTFELKSIKLQAEGKEEYTYKAVANGRVQHFVDKERLTKNTLGKTITGAQSLLEEERNIEAVEIVTRPIPLPLIPFSAAHISFEFRD
jgi:hypothetical protein